MTKTTEFDFGEFEFNWVLTSPDNENYDEDFAVEQIRENADFWNVKVAETGNTRDQGAGQEKEFLLEGEKIDIEDFMQCIQENLY